jgi:hypothetical protein
MTGFDFETAGKELTKYLSHEQLRQAPSRNGGRRINIRTAKDALDYEPQTPTLQFATKLNTARSPRFLGFWICPDESDVAARPPRRIGARGVTEQPIIDHGRNTARPIRSLDACGSLGEYPY